MKKTKKTEKKKSVNRAKKRRRAEKPTKRGKSKKALRAAELLAAFGPTTSVSGRIVASYAFDPGATFFWELREEQSHSALSTSNVFEERWERYEYIREQLELNATRRGANLVDSERTRHILEGSPLFKSFNETVCATSAKSENAETAPSASVRGWAGGHANPDAAKFGKTQIPEFWTGERFMYEVSDILSDANARWFRQESGELANGGDDAEETPRFVCVEERFGVPIRVVAEQVDDEMKCVTAFPDYTGALKRRGLTLDKSDAEEK